MGVTCPTNYAREERRRGGESVLPPIPCLCRFDEKRGRSRTSRLPEFRTPPKNRLGGTIQGVQKKGGGGGKKKSDSGNSVSRCRVVHSRKKGEEVKTVVATAIEQGKEEGVGKKKGGKKGSLCDAGSTYRMSIKLLVGKKKKKREGPATESSHGNNRKKKRKRRRERATKRFYGSWEGNSASLHSKSSEEGRGRGGGCFVPRSPFRNGGRGGRGGEGGTPDRHPKRNRERFPDPCRERQFKLTKS